MAKSSRRFVVLILAIVSSGATLVFTNVNPANVAANNSVVYDIVENKTGVITTNPTLTYTVWLPSVMKNWCLLYIEFTYVPPLGNYQDLQGRVNCVEPASYKVAVYIYILGWWTKPYWNQPLTSIRNDKGWTTDITTGGTDQCAVKIAAFLIPNGYNPPLISGGSELPPELYTNAIAYVTVDRNGSPCP